MDGPNHLHIIGGADDWLGSFFRNLFQISEYESLIENHAFTRLSIGDSYEG